MKYSELRNLCRDIVSEIEMLATVEKDEATVRARLQQSIGAKVEQIVQAWTAKK